MPEFIANPQIEPRPIPTGLVENPHLMLAMDQFKDVRGYTSYASRLRLGFGTCSSRLARWPSMRLWASSTGWTVGPETVSIAACEPEFRSAIWEHFGRVSVDHPAKMHL